MRNTIFFPFLIILVYLLMPAFIIAQDEKSNASTDHRVIRGGSWGYSTYVLPSWVRFNGYPYHGPQVGFRLVKVY